MKRIMPAVLATLAVLAAPLANVEAQESNAAKLEQRIEETKQRLNLSEEQVEQITPVLERAGERARDVFAKHGLSADNREAAGNLTFRQKRALGKDMKEVRAQTLSEIEPILSDEQLAEFKKMQEERRAQLREQIQARRGR